MALITPEFVKQNFPEWEVFCDIEGSTIGPDEQLQINIDRAEEEFLEYLSVDDTTITAQQRRHLLNIVRKNCFDNKHGSTEFDHEPQIYKDYKASIAALEQYRTRLRGIDKAGSISITARDREFDKWFDDETPTADTDPNN